MPRRGVTAPSLISREQPRAWRLLITSQVALRQSASAAVGQRAPSHGRQWTMMVRPAARASSLAKRIALLEGQQLAPLRRHAGPAAGEPRLRLVSRRHVAVGREDGLAVVEQRDLRWANGRRHEHTRRVQGTAEHGCRGVARAAVARRWLTCGMYIRAAMSRRSAELGR